MGHDTRSSVTTRDVQSRPPDEVLIPPGLGGFRLLLWRVRAAEELRWLRVAFLRILFGIVILVLWEGVSGPSLIFAAFLDLAISQNPDGNLWTHFSYTIENTFWGYAAGAAIGILLGFMLAEAEVIALIIEPYIMAFNGVPRIAYAPLFIAWFGIEREPKIILVLTIVFFLTFVSTFSGIRSVPQELVSVARVLGGGKLAIMRKVVLPAASPWIFSGLKISIPFGMVGAIVGEYIISDRGLGYLLQRYNNEYFTTGIILIIFILMIFVVLVNQILNWAESRVLRWRPTGRIGEETSIPG
jgi:NitT/TauT family transport system permease protein